MNDSAATDGPEDQTGRPETAAACLERIAEHLTNTDRLIAAYAKLVGKENPISGANVQADLAVWAAWLRTHPEVDDQLMALVQTAPAPAG